MSDLETDDAQSDNGYEYENDDYDAGSIFHTSADVTARSSSSARVQPSKDAIPMGFRVKKETSGEKRRLASDLCTLMMGDAGAKG